MGSDTPRWGLQGWENPREWGTGDLWCTRTNGPYGRQPWPLRNATRWVWSFSPGATGAGIPHHCLWCLLLHGDEAHRGVSAIR